jgi:hypothetical protein
MGSGPQLSRRGGLAPRLFLVMAMALMVLGSASEAYAAAAGQCLNEVSSWAPEVPGPQRRSDKDAYWDRWMCDGSVARGEIHHRMVPMCLSEGASAIAPLTLLPVDDSRIEAIPHCTPWDAPDRWVPSPDQGPEKSPPAISDALVPSTPKPEPSTIAPRVLLRRAHDERSAGHRFAIFRPPRG